MAVVSNRIFGSSARALVFVGTVGAVTAGYLLREAHVTPWILACCASVALTWAFIARLGIDLGVAAAVAGLPAYCVTLAVVARAAQLDLAGTLGAGQLVLGIAAAGLLSGVGDPIAALQSIRRALVRGWAAFFGAATLVVSYLVAAILSRGAFVGWAMGGDSANNILFARSLLVRGGVDIAGPDDVTPVPYALLAAVMPTRNSLPAAAAAADISAYATLWMMMIAAMTVLAAAVVMRVASTVAYVPRWFGSCLGGAIGLASLSWFVSGYAVEFGFFNAHVVVVLLLGSMLATLQAAKRPAVALAVVAADAALVMATWTPLAAVPLALALAILVRHRAALRAASARDRWAAGIAGTLALGYLTVRELPLLASAQGTLATQGGIIGFPRPGLPILAALVAVAALRVALGGARDVSAVAVAAALALLGGLGGVLVLGGSGFSTWGYYPHKFAWIGEVLLLIVLAGLLAGLFARPKRTTLYLVAVVTFALCVPASWGALRPLSPPLPHLARAGSPFPATLIGAARASDGDVVFRAVVDNASDERLVLLWRTDLADESKVNFWTIELATAAYAEVLSDAEIYSLRLLAYEWTSTDPTLLCRIAALAPVPVVVKSRDDEAREATAKCSVPIEVEWER